VGNGRENQQAGKTAPLGTFSLWEYGTKKKGHDTGRPHRQAFKEGTRGVFDGAGRMTSMRCRETDRRLVWNRTGKKSEAAIPESAENKKKKKTGALKNIQTLGSRSCGK